MSKLHTKTYLFINDDTHHKPKSYLEKLECYACHSIWAPQCYGCHVKVDYSKGKKSVD